MELVYTLLAGGVGAGVVKLIETVIVLVFNRRAKMADAKTDAHADLKNEIGILKTAQRAILKDRIKYLGRRHINDGEITLDDRIDMFAMHAIYHGQLDGNGDLDQIMQIVGDLPIKTEGR